MSTTLRLIELTTNNEAAERLKDAFDDVPSIEQWTLRSSNDQTTMRLLVPLDAVEAVFDTISERELAKDSFRVILFPIEATLPPVEQSEEQETSEEGAEQKGNSRQRGRVSRDELLNDLLPGTEVSGIYIIMVMLSAVVAVAGLLNDDVAVVIGAMVIAPLLLPNMALALATTLGDLKMAGRAVFANTMGVAVAFMLAYLVGLVLEVDVQVEALRARTRVSMGSIALGLAAGAAGAISVTTGVSPILIGVMVAVALLPPLVATGLLLGAGAWGMAGGAALLLAVNVICINLAAVGTFLAQGIRPRTWYEAHVARRATFIALGFWMVALLGLAALVWLSQAE